MRLFVVAPLLWLLACSGDVGVVKHSVDNDCDGEIDVGATDPTTA